MTSKQYIQKWRAWMHKHTRQHQAPLTRNAIWEWQKTILSPKEQRQSENFQLYLEKNDPRHEALDQSDRAWQQADWA